MGRERDRVKWEAWRQRLEEFDRGTATVSEFCERVGVSQATFYQWQRKLRSTVVAEPQSQVAPTERRTKSRQTTQPLHFLPVEINAASQIEVLLRGGVCLRIPSHDAQAIRTVLTALLEDEHEHRPC